MEWKIGNVEIKNKVVFAPMAGVSNQSYRSIIKQMGSGLIYIEMVSVEGIKYNSKKTIELLKIEDNERPISIQIFGSDKESFIKSAKYIEEHIKPDIIDINMGCPAPKVVKNGDGSKLLLSPNLVGDIVENVVKNTDKPVTVKIRKGWNNEKINAVEIAKVIESAGASAITIHGRTREEYYSRTC